MRGRAILSLFLLYLVFPSRVEGQEWKGLWRVTNLDEQGRASTNLHLHISTGEVEDIRVYDNASRPLHVINWEMQGKELFVSTTRDSTKPLPLNLTLIRSGNKVAGNWAFQHPQYPVKGPIVAKQILSRGPSEFSEVVRPFRTNRVLDLVTPLLAESPFHEFSQFNSYWEDQILPTAYYLVQSWLYGSVNETEESHLRGIFKLVSNPSSSNGFLKGFPVLVEETLRRAKVRFSQRRTSFFIVSMPAPVPVSLISLWSAPETPSDGKVRCCSSLIFEDLSEAYVILNPFLLSRDPDFAAVAIQRQILSQIIWPKPTKLPEAQLMQQGLALQLAMELENRAAIQHLSQEEMDAYRDQVQVAFSRNLTEIHKGHTQDELIRCGWCMLGYTFAATMFSGSSVEEVLSMDETALQEHYHQLLRAEKVN